MRPVAASRLKAEREKESSRALSDAPMRPTVPCPLAYELTVCVAGAAGEAAAVAARSTATSARRMLEETLAFSLSCLPKRGPLLPRTRSRACAEPVGARRAKEQGR